MSLQLGLQGGRLETPLYTSICCNYLIVETLPVERRQNLGSRAHGVARCRTLIRVGSPVRAVFRSSPRSPFRLRRARFSLDSRESRSQITTESFKPAFGHSHRHQLQTHTVTRGPSVKRMRRGRSRVQVVNRSLRGSGSHSKRRAHSTSLSSREANPAREVQPALNTLLPPSHRLPSLLIIVIIVIIDDGGAARAAPPSDLTRSSRARLGVALLGKKWRSSRARLGVRLCSLGSGCGHRRLGQRALRRETWRVRQCLALASLRG